MLFISLQICRFCQETEKGKKLFSKGGSMTEYMVSASDSLFGGPEFESRPVKTCCRTRGGTAIYGLYRYVPL